MVVVQSMTPEEGIINIKKKKKERDGNIEQNRKGRGLYRAGRNTLLMIQG
jgi:hypothetical protein